MSEPFFPPHPQWYDPQADFAQPRYMFACRLGANAAAASSDWSRIETVLQCQWLVVDGGLTWEEARPAIYHSWFAAKVLRGG